MTFYDMTWLERLLFLKRIKGGSSGHEETTTSNTFVTDMVAPLRKLLLSFAPKQSGSGDPSPDNVRPISGWDGVSVTRTGANIADWSVVKDVIFDRITPSSRGENSAGRVWFRPTSGDGYPTIIGASSTNPKTVIAFKENTQYTIILDIKNESGSTFNMGISYTDGSSVGLTKSMIVSGDTLVYTTTAGKTLKNIYVGQYNSVWTSLDLSKCFVGEGVLTADDFEPYAGQTYSVSWNENLLDLSTEEAGYISASGVVTVDGYSSHSALISVNVGASYVFSGVAPANLEGNKRVHGYDASGNWVQQIAYKNVAKNSGAWEVPFVVPSGISYIKVSHLATDTNLKVARNTVYGGTLDMVSGVLTVTQKLVDLGSLAWSVHNEYFRTAVQSDAKKGTNGVLSNAHCSALVVSSPNGFLNTNNSITVSTDGRFTAYSTSWTGWTGEQVREVLDGVMFAYELATPITYQLTPQQINTLIGTNVITTDANVEEIIYLKKAE